MIDDADDNALRQQHSILALEKCSHTPDMQNSTCIDAASNPAANVQENPAGECESSTTVHKRLQTYTLGTVAAEQAAAHCVVRSLMHMLIIACMQCCRRFQQCHI